jgi:alanine racemase
MGHGLEKWVEVDLKKVAHNVQEIRRHLKPDTIFMAVVKADAYGHGIEEISRAAIQNGADWLSVSNPREGEYLRKHGFKVPILVLAPVSEESARVTVENDLIQGVDSIDQVEYLGRLSRAKGKRTTLHIKIDTGLGRFGILPENVIGFAKKASTIDSLSLQGIYTHFASPYSDPDYTRQQYRTFMKVKKTIKKEGIPIKIFHCANSPSAMDFPYMHLDAVRIGFSLCYRCRGTTRKKEWSLLDCLEFKTKIISIKEMPPGAHIGYENRFLARHQMTVAVIPVGYVDGIPTSLANRGHVLIKGKKLPLIGSICFSQSFVDLTSLNGKASVGDEVTLIGKQGNESITYRDIAEKVNAGNTETVLRITKAVPRVYRTGSDLV